MKGFISDLFHVAFKAVSATPFCAEAEVFTAADTVVTHISSRSFFIAQFTHLRFLQQDRPEGSFVISYFTR